MNFVCKQQILMSPNESYENPTDYLDRKKEVWMDVVSINVRCKVLEILLPFAKLIWWTFGGMMWIIHGVNAVYPYQSSSTHNKIFNS